MPKEIDASSVDIEMPPPGSITPKSDDALDSRRAAPAGKRNGIFPPWEVVRSRAYEIPVKTLLLTLFLFSGGVTLLSFGLICMFKCEHWVGLVVVGTIMILPGCYSARILFNFIRGIRGYSWRDLPQMD